MSVATELDAWWDGLDRAGREAALAELAEQGLSTTEMPVTAGQAAMLFLEEMQPGNPAYQVHAVARATGPLDMAGLRAALQVVVNRHETLRCRFRRDGSTMAQVVDRYAIADLDVLDVDGGEAAAEAVIAGLLAEPILVDRSPLWRLHVLRTGPEESLLVLRLHHLVCDGWSIGLFVAELGASYRARAQGGTRTLPELSIQYGDYAAWSSEQDEVATAEAPGRRWWQEHLKDMPSALSLPTDLPVPPVQSFRGGSEPFALSGETIEAVAALGRAHGATPFMVLLTAFQVLLTRLSGQDAVVVGVPDAGRRRTEVEPLIGFFVNMLPVAVDLSGPVTFSEALVRCRDACRGGYAHGAVPFERIVEDAGRPRDLSRPPLFQTAFSYQAEPFERIDMGADLRMERVPRPAPGSRFWLEIQSFSTPEGVAGWFEYDAALFRPSTVAQWCRSFELLVESALAGPAVEVDRLPLLTPAERAKVVGLGSGETRTWPGVGILPELVDAAVAAHGSSPAVTAGGRTLDYADFGSLRNRFGYALRARGLGVGNVVAVALERSTRMVVSLHAVMAAGAVFLPVDLAAPEERLRSVLQHADLLVTTSDVLAATDGLASAANCPVWLWDEEGGRLADLPDGPLPVEAGPEDPAYLIYTSGSTGLPKGVVNTHRGLRNRLLWMQDAYDIGPGDRVLQKTPYTFDVSVWEFFWPLFTGAELVVLPPGLHRDPARVAATVRDENISVLHFVPSMLRLHLNEPAARQAKALRWVVCSGEALPRSLVEKFHDVHGTQARQVDGPALENLYGPTEAAIDVTSWSCSRAAASMPVPIGRPIANTSVYVLDGHGEPVPPGVVGELYLGGDNVALGYKGRPDLTAERFAPDPFRPGGIMYRTGDLGRLVEDGHIPGHLEYMGRIDRQVKLRGVRMELPEIEAVLNRHPAVRASVVSARTFGPGDVRLVGYVQEAGGGDCVDHSELTAHLRRYLPEQMIPGIWAQVEEFPLSANGKCDESKLPLPSVTRPERRVTPARDDLERTIVGTWVEVLGATDISVDDAFFDVGGHSLLLIQVRELLVERLGVELTMVDLFQHPTPAALAAFVRGNGGSTSEQEGRSRAARRVQARAATRRRADIRTNRTGER